MSKGDLERYHSFSRRAFILGGLHLAGFGILTGRLLHLQVSRQDYFATLADENRISMKYLQAERGQIVDRFGVPLAVNEQDFRAFLIPEQSPDLEETFRKVREYIPLSLKDEERVLRDIKSKRAFMPVMLRDGLSWEQVARISVNLPDLPGVSIDEGRMRAYPLSEATAHLVGYVGLVAPAELTDEPIMGLPGFRIGKTGIEKYFDKELRGKAGTSRIEINAVGREVREISSIPGKDGDRVGLTLDAELQIYCQSRLAQEKSASAVIMDAVNGQIYAMCSTPSFDPNNFTRGISAEQWEELLSNPAAPLTNKAVSGQYPPGSTFKMVTALAAFKSGLVKPDHRVHCPGYMEIGRDKFHCWSRGGHGSVDITQALAQSCDVYFYDIARQVGIDKIAEMARRLGLGEKHNIELPGETPGLVPDKNWKLGHFGKKWQLGETVVSAIGQGYIQTTPLQLAVMLARIVNGGRAVKPTLLHMLGTEVKSQPEFKSLGISPHHIELVKKGMANVVNHPKGTAHASRIDDKSFQMGGKTGTAQVRRITAKQRAEGVKNEDLPWKQRHHALFTAFAPLKKPRYVCAVVVEHGVSGSGTAAPLARDLMLKTKERDPAS
ncbi:MAG: penicillin-binding protein 2 [Alphaproteobacteria bacterium]|nr:MAG: penicillin-binding protein 2 [Alphaproteobacteria bacterium]